MTYLFCFIWTPLFVYIAEKQAKMGNKKNCWMFMLFAILVPSLVAGLRSLDVGRDIETYITPTIKNSLSMDFVSYMKSPINIGGSLESGFRLLIYAFAHISSSPNFTLFMLQFLTIFFVSLFTYKNREKMSMTIVMTIYILSFYFYSLTFMRQGLTISIILYATTLFEEKKYLKTLIWFLLGISLHSACILSIIIFGLMYLSQNNRKKNIVYFIYIVVLIISSIFFENIIYFLTNTVPILPVRFYNYTQVYLQDSDFSPILEVTVKLFFIFSALLYMKFANKNKSKIDIVFVLALLLTDFATELISYKIVNANRMGLYFYYLGLFYLVPNLKFAFKEEGKISLVSIFCITVLFGFWVWRFPIANWCDEFPYKSDIINFLH